MGVSGLEGQGAYDLEVLNVHKRSGVSHVRSQGNRFLTLSWRLDLETHDCDTASVDA